MSGNQADTHSRGYQASQSYADQTGRRPGAWVHAAVDGFDGGGADDGVNARCGASADDDCQGRSFHFIASDMARNPARFSCGATGLRATVSLGYLVRD